VYAIALVAAVSAIEFNISTYVLFKQTWQVIYKFFEGDKREEESEQRMLAKNK
jgi:hypothetical protein